MIEFVLAQAQQPSGSPAGPPLPISLEDGLPAQDSLAGLVTRVDGTLEELADALDREANSSFYEEANRPLGQNMSSLLLISDMETFKKALNHILDGDGIVRLTWEDLDPSMRHEISEGLRAQAGEAFDAAHEKFVRDHPDATQEAEILASLREPLLERTEFGGTIIIIP